MKKIVVALVLLGVCLPAAARPFDVTLSAGAALPGVIQASLEPGWLPADTGSITSSLSPAVVLSASWWPVPWLAPTVAVHYAALFLPAAYDLGTWDGRDHVIPADGIHFIDVEAGIRASFPLIASLAIEPYVSLGYCHTFSSSPDAINNGLTLDLAADVVRDMGGFRILVTLGGMMQLYGGVEGIAFVRSDAVPYVAFGIGF